MYKIQDAIKNFWTLVRTARPDSRWVIFPMGWAGQVVLPTGYAGRAHLSMGSSGWAVLLKVPLFNVLRSHGIFSTQCSNYKEYIYFLILKLCTSYRVLFYLITRAYIFAVSRNPLGRGEKISYTRLTK